MPSPIVRDDALLPNSDLRHFCGNNSRMVRLEGYAAFETSMTSYPRLLRRWTSLAVERLRATWSR